MVKIPDNINKKLSSFLEEIRPICSLDKVVLFGSLAKGKGSAESDVDLAIFSRTASDDNRLQLMAKILSKIPKYKLDIQPLVFSFQDYESPDNSFIQNEIKGNGIILE
jgi:predicted nucleotidyltransferase